MTDRKGRRVFGLTREEFEVLEDGRSVDISHFRAPPAPSSATPRPPAAERQPASGASPPPTGVEPPAYLLLFVDTVSLRLRDRRRLFGALRESLAGEPDPLRLMLVTWNGRLRVWHGFDSTTEEVLATLDGLERGRVRSPFESERLLAELVAAADELEGAAGTTPQQLESARSRRDSAVAEISAYTEGQRQDLLRTVDVLRQLAFSLGGVAGRKSILYAGDNLTMAPASELRAAAGSAFGSGGAGASAGRPLDLYLDFKRLVRQANASGVDFYTVTPPSRQHLGGVTVAEVGPVGFQTAIRTEREDRIKEAVCLMSHTTGGRCQAGGTDFRRLIDSTVDDLAAFYSLGYVPDRRPDGEYHRLEVRVKRRGLRTRHREGYVDRTPGDRLRERLSAALWFGAEEDRLGVALTVEEQHSAAPGTHVVPIRVTVPIDRFALLPTAEPGTLAASGRMLLVAAGANGRTSTSEEIPVAVEVEAARIANRAAPLLLTQLFELRLRRGEHKVAVAVWDESARQGSFLSRVVTVGPGAATGVAPSAEPR